MQLKVLFNRYFRLRNLQKEVIEFSRWIGAGGLVVALYRPNPFDKLTIFAIVGACFCFVISVVLRSALDDAEKEGEEK